MITRDEIDAKREMARQKAEAAKLAAKTKMHRLKNPLPPLMDMPTPTGNIEVDGAAELAAVERGLSLAVKNTKNTIRAETDSEYWAAICFQTREQKEAFLAALDMLAYGDKYISGAVIAKKLGIVLPEAHIPYESITRRNKSWDEFVR